MTALTNEIYHVMPTDDLRQHTSSMLCKCTPTLVDGSVIVHHSFDGREFFEDDEIPEGH